MSIEKINSNFEGLYSPKSLNFGNANQNRIYLGMPKDSTSFTGAGAATAAASKNLKDFILEIMPKKIKNMVKTHEGMGEIQNQLINAIGTGLVAPLFIKYNPISDTDKDTRTYTAWRQPISAVLAVATQCAIVIPFNAAIKRMSDIGYAHLPIQYNSSLFPSDSYIKKQIKKDHPNEKYSKQELEELVKQYKKNNDKALENMIKNDKIILTSTDVNSATKIELPAEDFKKLFLETINKVMEEEKTEKLNAINHKLPQKIERGIFYNTYPEESEAVLQRLSNKISQIYAQSDFGNSSDKIVDASKEFGKECKQLIKDLKGEIKKDPSKRYVNNELIKIVKEVSQKNTGSDANTMRTIEGHVNKMMESLNRMRSMKSTKEIMEYVNEVIYKRTEAIDSSLDLFAKIKTKLETSGITVQEAQSLIDEKIVTARNAILTKLRAQGLSEKEINESIDLAEGVSSRLSEKTASIAKNIGEQLKSHVKANIDGLKRWTGLGVSLAILPATCWLLNRIYPWFMDLAFPKLSHKAGKANATDEDKNNNKKGEVK